MGRDALVWEVEIQVDSRRCFDVYEWNEHGGSVQQPWWITFPGRWDPRRRRDRHLPEAGRSGRQRPLRKPTTNLGVSAVPGSLSSAGSFTSISLALAMRAGPMPLPRVLSPLPTTSGSIVHAGTGSDLMAAQVFGSRGVASEKT